MKKIITSILVTVLLAGALVALSPAAANAAARYPGDPIPGCQYQTTESSGVYWHEMLDFWYTRRFRTSNGTCPGDAVRFWLDHFRASPSDCARVWLRTFNDDGSLRRVWPAQDICPGQERAFMNVDRRRLFRIEIRSNYLRAIHNPPLGAFSF